MKSINTEFYHLTNLSVEPRLIPKFSWLAFAIRYFRDVIYITSSCLAVRSVLIATHSVPDRLYCLQVLSCSWWKGENSGVFSDCNIGKQGVPCRPFGLPASVTWLQLLRKQTNTGTSTALTAYSPVRVLVSVRAQRCGQTQEWLTDRGTSTCASRKSLPPVNTLAWFGLALTAQTHCSTRTRLRAPSTLGTWA